MYARVVWLSAPALAECPRSSCTSRAGCSLIKRTAQRWRRRLRIYSRIRKRLLQRTRPHGTGCKENFNWNVLVDSYQRLYRTLAANRHSLSNAQQVLIDSETG